VLKCLVDSFLQRKRIYGLAFTINYDSDHFGEYSWGLKNIFFVSLHKIKAENHFSKKFIASKK